GPFHAGAVFDLLRGLAAPPAEPIALTVEGLTFNLTDDVWAVGDADGADGVRSITCLPPACREHADVAIGADPVPLVGTCEAMPPAPDAGFRGSEMTLAGDDVVFTVTTWHSL